MIEIGNAPDSWGIWFPNDDRQVPWSTFLDEVAAAKFSCIELGPWGYLPTGALELRRELESRGLHLVASTVGCARSWSYITLGFGHGEEWWRQFCYRLKMGGYDGWLSIEHEDVLLNSLEGLEKSIVLLQHVMPEALADYKPQTI